MKAAVVEQPGVIVVREVPEPELTDYAARTENLFGATCTGTDRHLLSGSFPFGVEYPTILGHETVGRVVQLGPKVRHLREGDLVPRAGVLPPMPGIHSHWGGFAEFGLVHDLRAMREDGLPEPEWIAYRSQLPLPAGTDPAGATMIITWRETLSYIARMGVGYGASVLVLGSGGTGLSLVNHARNLLAEPVVLVGSPSRFEPAGRLGAVATHDYAEEQLAERMAQDFPEGFDFIIDAVGRRENLDRVLPLLRPGGMLGTYGVDEHFDITVTPSLSRGTFVYYNGGYEEAETHEQVLRLMSEGRLEAGNYLDLERVFALEEIAEAFAALDRRELIKALIRIRG